MKWWLISAVLTWLLCRLAAPILRRAGVIDRPNDRSSHVIPTIRGGGVGIILAIVGLAASGVALKEVPQALVWILGLAIMLAVVSFADDVRPAPAFARLLVQAILAAAWLWALEITALPLLALLLAWIWICGYTNAFNFMDGINGLAAIQALITGIGTAAVAWAAGAPLSTTAIGLALVISGSAAGFLPHNFPRARMFMGDVSSAPLGFLLAALALWIARDFGWHLLLPLGLLHANFILDTGLTLCRRIFRREKWYQSHREHFYQRLARAGWSHTAITSSQAVLQLSAMMAVVWNVSQGRPLGACAVMVVAMWLAFFTMAESIFLRHQAGSRDLKH